MKISNIIKASILSLVVFFMFNFFTIDSNAKVNGTAGDDNSITITWDDTTKSDYIIGYVPCKPSDMISDLRTAAQNMANQRKIVVNANTKSYTIKNLSPDSEYYIVVGYTYGSSTLYTNFSSCTVYTKMTAVKNVTQYKWWKYAKDVDVTWDEKPGYNVSYEVKFMNSKGKVIEQKIVRSNRYSHSIKNDTIYTVQVRAKRDNDVSPWSVKTYLFTQPTIKTAKVNKGKMTISWNKIKGATSYTVYVSTKKNKGYKKIATVKGAKTTYTIKKFKGKKFLKNKTYYVYVTANKKVGGKLIQRDVTYTYEVKNNATPRETYK